MTLADSLFIAGLLSEAEVLAPGVPALEMTKPYRSVVTFTGVLVTASDVASTACSTHVHAWHSQAGMPKLQLDLAWHPVEQNEHRQEDETMLCSKTVQQHAEVQAGCVYW